MSQLRNIGGHSMAETSELTKMSENYRANRNLLITWCAGLIGISLIILQDDIPILVSLLALSLALPLLTGTILFSQFEIRNAYVLKPKKGLRKFPVMTFCGGVFGVFIGIDAAIWHLTWIAGMLFLVISFATFVDLGTSVPHFKVVQRVQREEAERERALE